MRWRSKSKIGSPGKIIARRYRLEAPLAGGAMGTIWTAEHVRLKSRVAIKFLDPSIADDPEMLARFLREAQSAAAVRGTHVVQIFDCGVEKGDPYIAMELLQGESLEERLTFRGPLAPAELNKIFSEVAIAVDNAHALGVIHRDLKPGNIFLAREGELEITKVLDFGIAKVMDHSLSLATGSGTRTGTVLGTPNYMSPEQARGSSSLDHSTDLWSLAIIAFECLTGQHAFTGQTLGDVMVQICTELPRVPSSLVDVPAGFDQWFLKGASKDPAERFSSAREMAETLSEILVGASAPVARAADWRARLPDEPPSSEGATLHSRSVPPLSVAAREMSSPSLSPAQLATPAGAPRARLLDALLSSASGMLHSFGAAASLAGLRRSVSQLSVSKRSVSSRLLLLLNVVRRALRPLGVASRPLAPFAAPLSLVCALGALAVWYAASSRVPAGWSRPATPASDEIVTAAARLDPEPFEEPPALRDPKPGTLERGGASSLSTRPAAEPSVPPAQPDTTTGARTPRRASVPVSPARAAATKARSNPETPPARSALTPPTPPARSGKDTASSNTASSNTASSNTASSDTASRAADPFADRL